MLRKAGGRSVVARRNILPAHLAQPMVRYTAKDLAAQSDPRRFHVLPPFQIAGTTDGDSAALQRAYAHIEGVHRQKCVLGVTPLVVHRLTVLGIANDINYLVRAMAIAMRATNEGQQLLLLPPVRTPEGKSGKWAGDRSSLIRGRTMETAWHWLDGFPGASHRSIFWPSACQELLESKSEQWRMQSLVELSRNSSVALAAERVGLGKRVFDTELSLRMLARGIAYSDVPDAFRDHGVLWWWQALTTYVIRVRGAIAERVRQHPALREMLKGMRKSTLMISDSATQPNSTRLQYDWLEQSRRALSLATRPAGDGRKLGWVPPVAFDAGLHMRMGDACGPKARPHQAEVRKCVRSLRQGLEPLVAHSVLQPGARVFLATDSASIIEEAEVMRAQVQFEIVFLRLNRSKYDTEAWIELASAADRSQADILVEALLELLLLSRARFIAGSMYGNMPRLALQLRTTTPGDVRRLAYVTTDGRDWCTKPTCISNNTATARFW